MLKFLLDPKLFNYLCLILYALGSLRWALARRWADALYWLSAFAITAVITWGYKH